MAGSPLFLPIADDFRVSTWLALGAILYAALQRALPFQAVVYLPIFILAVRVVHTLFESRGVLRDSPNTLWGRYTTKIPASKPQDQAIVIFVLGARINQYVFYLFTPLQVR
jgi:hypothetical protein